jgi:hypothetical protein
MASTQTNIRRDPSFSVHKFVLDGGDTETGVVCLKGVKSLYLTCNGATKAYLPKIDETLTDGEPSATYGDLLVHASPPAYAELTLIDVDSTAGVQAHSSMQGSTTQPLQMVGDFIPAYAYFQLPADGTAWLYLSY